jgi:hypothetical protein
MIEIYNRATGEMVSVESWKTATPHFAITRPFPSTDSNIDVSDLFNVTHVRSTAIALGPFKDKKLAALCASIMGHLPVPWQDFTMAVSDQFSKPDPAQTKRFKAAWSKLPIEILAWRKAIADGCMMGDL